MRRSRTLLTAVVLLSLLTACGGGGSGSGRRPRPDVGSAQDAAGEVETPVDVVEPPDEGQPPGPDTEPTPDVPVDALPPAEVLPETTPDGLDDVGAVDAAPDAGPDAAPDVPVDVPPDVPADVPPDVPPDTGGPDVVWGPDCISETDDACTFWVVTVPACMEKYCNLTEFRCSLRPSPEDTPCDDGTACTEGDVCVAGACQGTPKECADTSACNGLETCDPATGECLPGTPIDCAAADRCFLWTCVDGLPAGENPCFQQAPVECSDDPCTGIEHCDPAEGCVVDEPGLCDPGDPCTGELVSCDVEAARAGEPGACTYDDGIVCDDGDACNGVETCDPETLGCLEGEALVCDDGDRCNGVEACDTVNGCSEQLPPLVCDDGLPCNGVETCDPVEGRCVEGADPCPDTDGDVCNGTRRCERRGLTGFECVAEPPVDCGGDPCAGLWGCDPVTGCFQQTQPVECDNGDPCDGVETCDIATGDCVDGPDLVCEDGDRCNGVMECVRMEGCVPDPFQGPVDCIDPNPCDGQDECDPDTGECVPGPPIVCEDGDVCNGVMGCDPEAGCVEEQAPPQCANGTVCDGAETCDPLTGECGPGEPLDCDDENTCTIDSCHDVDGCRNQVLSDGSGCSDGDPCTLDDTCAGGVCQPGHVTCLCPEDDAREPDGSAVEATFVDPPRNIDTQYDWDGVLCGSDADWVGLAALTGDRVIATLDHDTTYGNLGLRLENSSGLTLAIADGVDDRESIDWTVTADGPHYVVVFGSGGAAFENSYALSVYVVPAGVCAEDDLEDNDTLGTAVPLVVGQDVPGRICGGDPDWFSVGVTAGQTLTADLVYGPPDAAVAIELLDTSGQTLVVGTGVLGRQRARLDAAFDRTVLVRVTALDGSEADYQLTARTAPTSGCIDDFYEENDGEVSGARVAWGETIQAVLCPDDRDWYLIDLAPGDVINVDLLANPITTNLNLYLHRPASATGADGVSVVPGLNTNGEEHISYTVPESAPTGVWGIRVLGILSASAPYSLTVSGTGGEVQCQEDAFEPNDGPGTGPLLTDGQSLAARRCPGDDDWYRVQLSGGDVLTVDMAWTDGGPDLDLVIRDPSGTEVARGDAGAAGELLEVTADSDGAWSVGVVAAADSTNSYTLQVAVEYGTPPCDDDGYEQNDTRATATPIEPGTTYSAALCPGDDDWYGFTASAAEETVIRLTNAAGLGCSVVDDGGAPVASCVLVAGGAEADVTGADGPVFVLVTGGGAELATYTLLVTTTPIVQCTDDGAEPDDTLAAGRPAGDGAPLTGTRCPGDDDWFTFDLQAGEAVTASIDFPAAAGDLDLVLADAAGDIMHNDAPGPAEELAYIAPAAGTYGLRVTDEAGGWGAYVVTVTTGVFLCSADAFEPNDTQGTAAPLEGTASVNGQLCADELDWFAVDLAAGDTLIADLYFAPAQGALKLYAHLPNGQTAATSATVEDHEHLEYVAPSPGRYGLRIFGLGGAENVYQLETQVVPYVPPCEDDAGDAGAGNDSFATAALVDLPEPGREAVVSAQLCEGDEDWWGVDVPAGDILRTEIRNLPADTEVFFELYDPAGGLLDSLRTVDGYGSFEVTAAAAGAYVVRVYSDDPALRAPYEVQFGLETPYVCPEDGYEENDVRAAAAPATPGTPMPGHVCPGDEDWFAVPLGERDALAVIVRFAHAAGNLDLALTAPDGTVLASGTSVDDDEEAAIAAAAVAGTYGVRVFAPSGDVDNPYQLEVTHTPYVCPEDVYEPNDSVAAPSAAPLGDGEPVAAAVCGDDDWYPIVLDAGDGFALALEYETWGDLHLSLALVAPDGTTLLGSVAGSGGTAALQHTAAEAGTYYVHVWSPAGGDLEYTLTPGISPYGCTNDSLEPSTDAHPADLPAGGMVDNGVLCIGEEDWYGFMVEPGETVIATATFTHADGDLALEVLRPDGTSVAVSDGTMDSESASADALVGGRWLVRVYSNVPGTDNVYDLTVNVLPYTCTDDVYEDNDSQAGGHALTSGQTVDGLTCIGDDDWYTVTLTACQTLTVELNYTYEPDADLQLALHAPDGTVARTSRSATNLERIVYRVPTAGVWGVRVYPEVGAESSYTLGVTVQSYSCTEDIHEDYDHWSTPYLVTPEPVARPGGRHCCNDDDWFSVEMLAGERVTATLCHDSPTGNLDLALVAADGTPLVTSATNTVEHVAWLASAAGTYVVGVTAAPGVDNSYRLWLTLDDPYVCADDEWEQNDTSAAPRTLTLAPGGTVSVGAEAGHPAVLCTADDDWYAVTLTAGDRLTVDVTFDEPATCPASPDVPPTFEGHNLDVVVVGPLGTELAAGRSTDSNELVDLMAPQTGTYRVRITSPVFADQVYVATLGRQTFSCTEDAYEENDTRFAAEPIVPEDTPLVAWLCDAIDWYSFHADSGDTIDVLLQFSHAIGNLDLELYGPSGSLLLASRSLDDDETLQQIAPATGTFYVAIRPPTAGSAQNRYELTVEVAPYVCVDDIYEPNDSQAQTPPPYGDDATIVGQICPDNPDWFTVLLDTGEELTLDLTFAAGGDLDLYLRHPGGNVAATSAGTTNSEQIVFEAPAPGAYAIEVRGDAGAHNGYTLELVVVTPGLVETLCDNDLDDDGDGSADCLDSDCAADPACQAPAEICTGGVDEDGDGAVDCLDTDCAADPACVVESNCANDVDDDLDGDTDCDDTDCAGVGTCPALCLNEDLYEDNDSQVMATPVLPNFDLAATACYGDADWYRLDLSGGGTQHLAVILTRTGGDGALSVALFQGATLLDQCAATAGSPIVTCGDQNVLAGVYDVQVWATTGSETTYELAPVVGDGVCHEEVGELDEGTPGTCTPDAHAGCGGVAVALCGADRACHAPRAFPLGTTIQGGICNGDSDVFSFPATAGDDIYISLAFNPAYSNLKWKLYRPVGTVMWQETGTNQPKTQTRPATVTGTHFIQVFGDTGAMNRYSLTIEIR